MAAVIVALLMITASLVVGVGVTAAASDEPKVDVVFVFDNSQSTNENRYHMAQEVDGLDDRLTDDGIDVRYALVTYNETARTEQRPTEDFSEFERAMHFQTGGNEEHASDAILEATELDLRDDAETVVVVVTDEDDDSANATREDATSALGGHHFVAVSPATPYESSCAVHSPPCDNRTDNELRTTADQVGGDWIDVNNDAETIVDRIGDEVESTVTTTTTQSTSSHSSSSSPSFETESLSIDRTTAEIGDRVAINKTITNDGTADGTYEAYLSHDGTVLQERSVEIDEGETRTITFTHRFDEPGSYEMLVSHEVAGTVEVIAPRNASVTITSGAGNETSADATADNSTGQNASAPGLSATVTDARANGSVSIPVTNASLSTTDGVALTNVTVSVGDVNVTPSHDVAFDVELTANGTPPEGVEPLPEHVTNTTYLTVNDSLPDEHSEVAFEYTASSRDATLYRYDENASTWTALNRTAVDANGTAWHTNASNASTFAIGVRQPAIGVTGMELDQTTVFSGEEATATVTVRNDGLADGAHEVELTLDGRSVAVEEITVPAGETREVDLRFTPDAVGEHTVAVADASPQTLTVERATTEASVDETTEATSSPESPENFLTGASGGTGLAVTIALAVLLLGFVLRRQI